LPLDPAGNGQIFLIHRNASTQEYGLHPDYMIPSSEIGRYTIDPYSAYRLTKGINHLWEQFDRKLRVETYRIVRDGVTIRTGYKEDLECIPRFFV